MGLLDDAIREHLELKRRRGADPAEVEREENEALGAPRRGEFAQPEGDADTLATAPEDTAPEPAPDELGPGTEPAAVAAGPAEEPAVPHAPYDDEEPPAAVAAPEPEPADAPRDFRDEPWLEDEPVGPPAAEVAPPVADAPPPEAVVPDEEPGPDDDVLEETPEFLQETPEHDRLWFEQKPPRDFDFDS